MVLAKNLSYFKVNLLCLSLAVFMIFILGCSSPKPQDNASEQQLPPPNEIPPFTPDAPVPGNGLGNTNGNFNNAGVGMLDAKIMYGYDSRNGENMQESRVDCFKHGQDVAIRFPGQNVNGKRLGDLAFLCRNDSNFGSSSQFVDCKSRWLGGKKDPEIWGHRERDSFTLIFKDLPPGTYDFTIRTEDPSGSSAYDAEVSSFFEVCSED